VILHLAHKSWQVLKKHKVLKVLKITPIPSGHPAFT
jgi:hypothetical protein